MSYFKAKMHQIRFRLGLRPRPRWESLQRSPNPIAGFKGPTSNGRGGKETGREGMGGEEGMRGGQGRAEEGGRKGEGKEGRETEKGSEGIWERGEREKTIQYNTIFV